MSIPTKDKMEPRAQPTETDALSCYVTDLKARFGKYGLPAAEARRIVDGSMGSASLTDVLYRSREDGAK